MDKIIKHKAKSNYNSRPNRNLLRIDGFEDLDIGDNGEFARNLETSVDLNLALDRMTPQQRKVAQMLLDGYSRVEVCDKLGVSHQAVSDIIKRIRLAFLTDL